MRINSITKLKKIEGKIVLLRVDFNTSLEKSKVKEDYRMIACLPTINYLLEKKCRLVIMAHLGSPQGKRDIALSLKPVALHLKKLLKKPLKFIPETVGLKVQAEVAKLKNGEILFLENLRFNSGELNNDLNFAKELARLGNIYVNEAFSVSHRNHASVSNIKKYLPSHAGLLLEEEIKALNKILKPVKPLVVIMGGSKISTKLPLIKKLSKSANQILLGGALVNNFFKFQGLEIGKTLHDKDDLKSLKIFYTRKKVNSKIILPVDVIVKTLSGKATARNISMVKKSDCILDIGPKTISLFATYIKKAQTLVWNGPMGKFEEASFKNGTMSVARLVATRSGGKAYGVVGGGETVEALKLTQMAEYIDFVSTAGGAMLSYLGGEKMPGLNKIVKK